MMTAATGIGHGAATPTPQPATSPADTDSGTLMPKGWPGSCSRTATALPNPAAPANASVAAIRTPPEPGLTRGLSRPTS
jgi:hypothetical protein